MAFVPSNAAENDVAQGRPTGAKNGQSAKNVGLLQLGSKRRAPFGDVTNRVDVSAAGLGHSDLDKAGAAAGAKPGRPLTRALAAGTTVSTGGAPLPTLRPRSSAGRAVAEAPRAPRTRSQTRSGGSAEAAPQASTRLPAATSSPPLPDIDAADRKNIFLVADYVHDIFQYYKRVEPKFRVAHGYMKWQVDINEKMRSILIDWLAEVHMKFKLAPETIYLTVNIIDRFLEKKQVTRRNLQLVGVTAMLIASKYEEIWAPEVQDFVYISDRAYSRGQILECEQLMLNTLKFNLTLPTYYNFLSRFLKAACKHTDRKVASLATYLVELCLVEAGMLKYSYSLTAAAAVFVATLAFYPGKNAEELYPLALEHHSGFSLQQIQSCAASLVDLMSKAPTSKLTAVFKKYNTTKLLCVATTSAPVLNPEWQTATNDMMVIG